MPEVISWSPPNARTIVCLATGPNTNVLPSPRLVNISWRLTGHTTPDANRNVGLNRSGPSHLLRAGHIRNCSCVSLLSLEASILYLQSVQDVLLLAHRHTDKGRHQHGFRNTRARAVLAGDSDRIIHHHSSGPSTVPPGTSSLESIHSIVHLAGYPVWRVQMLHLSVPAQSAQAPAKPGCTFDTKTMACMNSADHS